MFVLDMRLVRLSLAAHAGGPKALSVKSFVGCFLISEKGLCRCSSQRLLLASLARPAAMGTQLYSRSTIGPAPLVL